MRPKRPDGVLRGLAGMVAVLVAALGGVVSVQGAMAAEGKAERCEEVADVLAIEAAVWQASQAQLRETNLGALAAVGAAVDEGALVEARRARIEARERLAALLTSYAGGQGAAADAATEILAVIEGQALPDNPDLHRLWDTRVELRSAAEQSDAPEVTAVHDLGEVSFVAGYVVSDAIDAWYTRRPVPVPDAARVYFQNSQAYIQSGEAGWLAADRADPYSGTWVPRAAVRRQLPEAEAGLDTAFAGEAASALVVLDDWVKSVTAVTSGPMPPPPMTLEQAWAHSQDLSAELVAVTEATFEAETASALESAAAARTRSSWLRILTVIVALVVVAGMVWARRRGRSRLSALEEAAETDGLTGLANRRAVHRRVPERLADPGRAGHAVIQLDLDRFKAVNDTYGHRVGDELLVAFAGRAAGVLAHRFADRDGDVEFARIGGDEFLVVLHDSPDPRAEAHGLVADIEAAFRSPIACGPVRIRVDLSGGIAVAVEPTDLDRLLLEADIALYQAKAARHGSFEVFEEPALRDIMRDFPKRVAEGAVRADLQPQFDMVTGAVVGFEALARWSADAGDPVPAAVWIKAVEQLGGADLLFAAVARSVADAAVLVGDRHPGRYWLNVSPIQLGEPGSAERLLHHLAAVGLAPDRVGLEVVETAAVNDLGVAAENLEALRAAGVAVALDDFGSGFTPLGHLTALPVDLLKLDRSVVAALDNRPRQAALVEAMVTIAERLGIELIAEGIETEAERDRLLALGVRCGQGYLLGRPAPPAAAVRLLDEGRVAVPG